MQTLQEVYDKYSAPHGWGDKGTLHSYIDFYADQMTKRSNVSVLEIGVEYGHSIAMWQEYFANSKVYGIDIKQNKLEFELDNFVLGDATDPDIIRKNFSRNKFDYVVDDGSHIIADQIATFDLIFPKMKKGGKYFIEDVSGDSAINAISSHLEKCGYDFEVFDMRNIKGRYDDIIIMITT
jgi:ubiquinone/menaquinone biosynthesis C-methylase UbiE